MKALKITGSEAARRKSCSIGVIRRAEIFHGVELYRNPRYKTKSVNDELLAQIKELVAKGMTMPEIAVETVQRYNYIKNICYQNGLRARPTPHDERASEEFPVPTTYGNQSLLYRVPKEIRELVVNKAWK